MEGFPHDSNRNSAHDAVAVLNELLNGTNVGETSRLYGRTEELERIYQVYQRATAQRRPPAGKVEQRTEFVVIDGETGSGKTALAVRSLATQLSRNGGYCVLGKFDQLIQLQRPHAAFVDAFTKYAEDVMERRDVERVRRAVRASTEKAKDAIQVLINMVPALEKILLDPLDCAKTDNKDRGNNIVDDDISSPSDITDSFGAGEFSSSGASTHCKYALRMFLRALASPETPLVLILDDCHWMDGAALDILQSLLTDTMIRGIIFVGTYRSDRNSHEPFTALLRELSQQLVNVTKINLTKFSEAAICSMLSEIFQADELRVAPLANFISIQTHGNIFFVLESLRAMLEDGYVRHDETSKAWIWDIEKVQCDFAGSMMEVVERKILHLPNETLETLKYAACLGTQINVEILDHLIVRDHSAWVIDSCLNDAAARGLLCRYVDPSSKVNWSFSHDSIREVTYKMIPEETRTEFHYRIGRRLYRAFAMEEADDRIFIIVSQLIIGCGFITDQNERIAVAKLCYHAGARAGRMLSFESAYKYFKHGVGLLETTCWRDEYDLCLCLYNSLAEVSYCTGRTEEVLSLVEDVSSQARSKDDMLRLYMSKVHALGSCGRVAEAIEYGFEVLRSLGEYFPTYSNNLKLFIELQMIRRKLKRRTSESILRIGDMADGRKSHAMTVMNLLVLYLFLHNHQRAPTVILRMVALSLDYGLCATSSIAFTLLGGLLCGPFNDLDEGSRIGKVGLAMYERFGIRNWLPRVSVCYYLFVHFWIGAYASAVDPLEIAYEVGMMHGDLEVAFGAALSCTFAQYEIKPLEETIGAYERLRERMLLYGQETVFAVTGPVLQCTTNLVGRYGNGGPTVFEGEFVNAATLSQFCEHNATLFIYANFHLMMLHYLFNDIERATACAKVVRPMIDHPPSGVDAALCVFFDGLIAVRNTHRKRKTARRFRRRAVKQLRRLRHWATRAPHTFLCRAFLLEAELRAVSGDVSAYSKYIAAIALAKDSGFLNIAAIGNELAARYFLQRSEEALAKSFLQEAMYFYERWGATAKVEHLRPEYEMVSSRLST